jgi:membrane-associated phospholipid phosphatase
MIARMALRPSEWIIVAYFAYLAVAAAVLPNIGQQQRRQAIGMAMAALIAILALAALDTRAIVLRDWMPLVYIVVGYRLPALLVTGMNEAFERRLLTFDRRWQVTAISARAPDSVIELLELAYLCCYPMIPIGFAILYFTDLPGEAERFLIAVLLSAFGCYGVLPWLPTRPPRAIEDAPVRSAGPVRRFNLRVLGLASVQLNTFPSGHVAASLATAMAVSAGLPFVGFLLLLLAIAITLGSVVGRYHYAADALAGTALAIVGFLISRAV